MEHYNNNYIILESANDELRSKYYELEFKYNKLVELIKELMKLIN